MEKQPVDDLFARKLRDAEVTPGADGFDRLQRRMNSTPLPVAEPKRRLAGWWYGIAASTLLGVLWLTWPREVVNTDKVAKQAVAPSGTAVTQSTASIGKLQTTDGASAVLTAQTSTKQRNYDGTKTRLKTVGHVMAGVHKPNEEPAGQSVAPVSTADKVPAVVPVETSTMAKVERKPAETTDIEKVPTGRTVILTIADPEPIKLAAQPVKAETAHSTPNLSQFFDKVKQIKSGEVFARATPARPAAEPRTGLGRLVNGVRESLRNENSLEP